MNRMSTGLCFAAAFGLAATLGAQSPTSTTTASRSTTDKDHDVTITGCLSKVGSSYTLTNAHMDTSASSSTTTGTSTTTASGTSTTGTSGTSATNREAAGSAMGASTWMLTGDSDLEKHVGHKIQVTGKSSWDASMEHGRTSGTTASGAGTTAAPPSTTTATSTATTGSNAEPRLDVKSIKMVSSSCS
jgi:hypothetical protein